MSSKHHITRFKKNKTFLLCITAICVTICYICSHSRFSRLWLMIYLKFRKRVPDDLKCLLNVCFILLLIRVTQHIFYILVSAYMYIRKHNTKRIFSNFSIYTSIWSVSGKIFLLIWKCIFLCSNWKHTRIFFFYVYTERYYRNVSFSFFLYLLHETVTFYVMVILLWNEEWLLDTFFFVYPIMYSLLMGIYFGRRIDLFNNSEKIVNDCQLMRRGEHMCTQGQM